MFDMSMAFERPDLPGPGRPARSPCRPERETRSAAQSGNLLLLWLQRARERRELRAMAADYPCYLLRDAGLRREDLMREGSKPFWRA